MPLTLRLLLLAALLCSACVRETGNGADSGQPGAAWMDERHPGPYRTVTVAGGEAERCMSCHQFEQQSAISSFVPAAASEADTADTTAPEDPLKVTTSHPGGWLAWHDANVVGCVSCHGGNAAGLSYNEAGHAEMYDRRQPPGAAPSQVLREASCGRCHSGELVPAAPLLSEGRRLMRELNCSACHSMDGFLSGIDGGPDLGRVGEKYNTAMLATLPGAVQRIKPGSRMPQFELPEQEAVDIAAFLAAGNVPDSPLEVQPLTEQEELQALELLQESRCVNCHELPLIEGIEQRTELPQSVRLLWQLPQGSIGPSLKYAGRRLDAGWIAGFLQETHAWYPDSRMPQYEPGNDEALLLARWIVSASRDAGMSLATLELPQQTDPLRGGQLFAQHGCNGCHSVNGSAPPAQPVGPSLIGIGDRTAAQWQLKAPHVDNLYDYLLGNLADPASVGNPRMPLYELDDGQRRAIVTALLAEPLDSSQREPALRPWQPDGAAAMGSGRDFRSHWDFPIPPQGEGPDYLSAMERDVHPLSCAVCHREQYHDWLGTRHSKAMSPGIVGQIVDMDSANYSSCLKCHALLSEQLHVRRVDGEWQDNPDYREELYLSGVSCATCHMRAHTRIAPQQGFQQYSWSREGLVAHPLERSELLDSSEFCWSCHQFEEDRALADGGPPLQNTNIEHRDWQQATGDARSCQDCHMPGGRHTFLGIHDAGFTGAALDISSQLLDESGNPALRVSIHTRDVGHFFPTYVTPAAFIEASLLDENGNELEGSLQSREIRRNARTRAAGGGGREWYDESDTRLPPATTTEFDFSLDLATYPLATQVHVVVRVEPDYFYHNAYGRWIEDDKRSEAGRKLLEQAREETSREASGYILHEAGLDLP